MTISATNSNHGFVAHDNFIASPAATQNTYGTIKEKAKKLAESSQKYEILTKAAILAAPVTYILINAYSWYYNTCSVDYNACNVSSFLKAQELINNEYINNMAMFNNAALYNARFDDATLCNAKLYNEARDFARQNISAKYFDSSFQILDENKKCLDENKKCREAKYETNKWILKTAAKVAMSTALVGVITAFEAEKLKEEAKQLEEAAARYSQESRIDHLENC